MEVPFFMNPLVKYSAWTPSCDCSKVSVPEHGVSGIRPVLKSLEEMLQLASMGTKTQDSTSTSFWPFSCSNLWHRCHGKKKNLSHAWSRGGLKNETMFTAAMVRGRGEIFILKNRNFAHTLTWDRSWPVWGSQEVMGAWECLVWRKRSERIWSCGNWTGNMESNPFLPWECVRERGKESRKSNALRIWLISTLMTCQSIIGRQRRDEVLLIALWKNKSEKLV